MKDIANFVGDVVDCWTGQWAPVKRQRLIIKGDDLNIRKVPDLMWIQSQMGGSWSALGVGSVAFG